MSLRPMIAVLALFAFSSCGGPTGGGSGTGTDRQALSDSGITGTGAGKAKIKKVPKGPGKKLKKPAAAPAKVVTLEVDEGVVFSTGQSLKDGSGLKVDLVVYRHGASIDLKSGRVGTDNQPVHKLGNDEFDSIAKVPCEAPSDSEKGGYVQLPKAGQAFTVRGNKSSGYYRVRVKSTTGTSATVEYEKCK